jgi:hypothetical protein
MYGWPLCETRPDDRGGDRGTRQKQAVARCPPRIRSLIRGTQLQLRLGRLGVMQNSSRATTNRVCAAEIRYCPGRRLRCIACCGKRAGDRTCRRTYDPNVGLHCYTVRHQIQVVGFAVDKQQSRVKSQDRSRGSRTEKEESRSCAAPTERLSALGHNFDIVSPSKSMPRKVTAPSASSTSAASDPTSPEALANTRRHVRVEPERIRDVSSVDYPGHFPNEDHSWDLTRFRKVRPEVSCLSEVCL